MSVILFTNRKSHTGFRLMPTSMTLNGLERRNSPYFAFFSPNSIALLANYVTVVEDKPITSVNIVSQFQSSTSGDLQRGLFAIAELLFVTNKQTYSVKLP